MEHTGREIADELRERNRTARPAQDPQLLLEMSRAYGETPRIGRFVRDPMVHENERLRPRRSHPVYERVKGAAKPHALFGFAARQVTTTG